jgi:hypothetical protein
MKKATRASPKPEKGLSLSSSRNGVRKRGRGSERASLLVLRFLSRAPTAVRGTVVRVDEEVSQRSARTRPLTERGEGDDLILGVPDPGLSPMTDSGKLRSRPGAEDALWLQRPSSSSRSRNQVAAPLETPVNVKGEAWWPLAITGPRAKKIEAEVFFYWGRMQKLLEIRFSEGAHRNTLFTHVEQGSRDDHFRKLTRSNINLTIQLNMYRNNDLLAVNINNTSTAQIEIRSQKVIQMRQIGNRSIHEIIIVS